MHVCVYMDVCLCMYSCVYACMYVCMYVCMYCMYVLYMYILVPCKTLTFVADLEWDLWGSPGESTSRCRSPRIRSPGPGSTTCDPRWFHYIWQPFGGLRRSLVLPGWERPLGAIIDIRCNAYKNVCIYVCMYAYIYENLNLMYIRIRKYV